MKTHAKLLAAVVLLSVLALVVFFSSPGSTGRARKIYEVQPEITVPDYRTDATRAIDAYERLMDRHMDLTETLLHRTDRDTRALFGKLDSIEAKINSLSIRIADIEKTLKIDKSSPPQPVIKAP